MGRYEQQLENQLKGIQSDLDIDREIRRTQRNREREVNAFKKLPTFTSKMEFWCDHCNIDFVAPAYKIWSKVHQLGSWHSMCPMCEGMVYRHISAKTLDPYYAKSEKVRVMRGENMKDMLQPKDYGFTTLYGDAFEDYYMRFQQQHEAMFNKYASMGLMGKTLEQKSEEEEIMQNYL